MPHVSRYPLEKKVEQEIWELLVKVLTHTGSVERMDALLMAIFTQTEAVMMAKRLAAIILIQQNKADAEVASELHLTRMTVMKLRLLFERQPGAGVVLKEALMNKNIYKGAAELIENLATYLAASTGGRLPRPRRRNRHQEIG